MEITTTPSCRIGWQGTTLHYTVRAQGATKVLVPEQEMGGLQFRVTNTKEVPGGVEAQVAVKVLGSALY